MRSITASGSSVIFISHDIDEVMEITDRITVLRDGEVAGELARSDATHAEDRRDDRRPPPRAGAGRSTRPASRDRPVFAARQRPIRQDAGARLAHGAARRDPRPDRPDRLGLRGDALSGLRRPAGACRARSRSHGQGRHAAGRRSRRALAIDSGFALLPADRQGAGGVDSLAVVDNMFLPDIDRFFRGGRMRNGEMVRAARALGARFEVRPNDPSLKLSALSGGNAQKVLIARWMNRAPLAAAARRADAGCRRRHPPADLRRVAEGGRATA